MNKQLVFIFKNPIFVADSNRGWYQTHDQEDAEFIRGYYDLTAHSVEGFEDVPILLSQMEALQNIIINKVISFAKLKKQGAFLTEIDGSYILRRLNSKLAEGGEK